MASSVVLQVWRLLQYNPFAATGFRLNEIGRETKNYDLIGLIGTKAANRWLVIVSAAGGRQIVH